MKVRDQAHNFAVQYLRYKAQGQTVAYLADALGITRFARPNQHRPGGWQSTTDPQDAIAWADRPIAAFHEEKGEKEAKHTSAA